MFLKDWCGHFCCWENDFWFVGKFVHQMAIAYKILTLPEADSFLADGSTRGSPLDIKDGYIHMCSTHSQVERVLNKYYSGTDVRIATISLEGLENVKFEPISNGDLYPHLYGVLPYSSVKALDTVVAEKPHQD